MILAAKHCRAKSLCLTCWAPQKCLGKLALLRLGQRNRQELALSPASSIFFSIFEKKLITDHHSYIYHHIPSYTNVATWLSNILRCCCALWFLFRKKTGRSSRWPTFVLESCFLQSHHCGLTGKPCCAQHDWPRKFLVSFGFIHDSYLKGFEILI